MKLSILGRSLIGLFFVTAPLALGGCRAAAKAVVSDSWEESLGSSVAESVKNDYRMLPDDHEVSVWARDMVAHLAKAAEQDRPSDGFGGYKVWVIDDLELVNAFAAPGGYLFLSTGLISEAKHCGEIAGVIAHELAHVTQRHSIEGIADKLVIGLAASAILGDVQFIASLVAGVVGNGFNRGQETEADMDGLRYLADSGYNPRGLADFFGALAEEEGRWANLVALTTTHPTSKKRMERLHSAASALQSPYDLASMEGTSCKGASLSLDEVKTRIGAPALTE